MVDSGSDGHNYTFNVTSECISKTSSNIQCFYHSFNVPENELMPHNKYSVKVAAVNVNGTGPFSNAIAVMSEDAGKIISCVYIYYVIMGLKSPLAWDFPAFIN